MGRRRRLTEGTRVATLPSLMKRARYATVFVVMGAGVAAAQPAPDQAPVPVAPAPPPRDLIKVTGRVIDALGKPVRGAKVTVEGAPETTRTDRAGRFTIAAAIGATLVVESKAFGVGLATVTGEVVDEIVLLSESQLGETIEVRSEAPAEAPGATQLDRQELQRIPGAGGDLIRALTALPGVVNLQVPLGPSGIVIRGSSPQDSKFLIDDFEVPVLFHNVGFRSITPAETIASLDYIPGGFDVAFGRASSGIVKLTTRAGSDKRSTQAEVSVIDGGLVAQGPIGNATRYMFALRRSTIDLILPSLIPDDVNLSLTTVPRYFDGQLRIDHELSQKLTLTVSALGTDDIFELYTTKNEDAASKRFYNRRRFVRVTASALYKDGPWTAKLALSGLAQQFLFEAGLQQKIDVRYPTLTPRFELTRVEPEAIGLKNVEWRTGGEIQVGRASIDLALPQQPSEGEANPVFDPNDTSVKFNGGVWVPDFAAWTAVAADFDPRVRVKLGARAEAFARPGEFALQPRGEVEIKVIEDWKLRLSAGSFRRPPEFQSEFLSETANSERSVQTIAGVQWEPQDGTRVQASTYYTDRTALLRRDDMGELRNTGRGKTYGAELLGTYRQGPWFAFLSYSYSRSTRVDGPGEMERLFDFDQTHSANASASWQKGHWQLGGRFQVYSGLPNTPVVGALFDSDRNIYFPINGPVNSDRAPVHHQLDVRVDYSWKWGPAQMTAFLDLQNTYLNESIVTYFYSYDFSQRTAFTSLPLIPSLGLRGVL